MLTMSLYGLHSLMERVRLGVSIRGWANLLFMDWEKLMQDLYLVGVSFTYLFLCELTW